MRNEQMIDVVYKASSVARKKGKVTLASLKQSLTERRNSKSSSTFVRKATSKWLQFLTQASQVENRKLSEARWLNNVKHTFAVSLRLACKMFN